MEKIIALLVSIAVAYTKEEKNYDNRFKIQSRKKWNGKGK